jgi:FecR-like protein
MFKTNLSFLVVAAGCIFLAHSSVAGPLSSAEVTKIINRVSVIDPAKGGHPAVMREVIKDDLGLRTGARSRSELLFQDNTLTRIGAETFFSFKTGTRDMTLEKGSMLLQVPKGLGGAKIHTAAVTAAITGTTILMEYIPGSYIKVLVLEGSLRLSRNGTFGDSLLLRPGKMVIMRPDAKKIPDPIDVDLEQIVKTSTLVNFPGEAPLPSMPLMQAAIDEQKKQLAKSDLVPTNLVIGHGTKVIFASGDQVAKAVRSISFLGLNSNGVPVLGSRGGTVGLPIVGSVTVNTPTSTTTAINNLLGSGGAVGRIANDLLGGSSSAPVVSVSSSTQLLGLLSNVAPTSGGMIAITPVAANVGATVAAVPASTVNATAGVPILNGATSTVPAPASVLTTVISAPTTPTTGVLASPGATTVPLSLRAGGH